MKTIGASVDEDLPIPACSAGEVREDRIPTGLEEGMAAMEAAIQELEIATTAIAASWTKMFVDGCRGLMAANGAGLLAIVTLANGTLSKPGLSTAGMRFLYGLTDATAAWILAIIVSPFINEYNSLARRGRVSGLIAIARNKAGDLVNRNADRVQALNRERRLPMAAYVIAFTMLLLSGIKFVGGARELLSDVSSARGSASVSHSPSGEPSSVH